MSAIIYILLAILLYDTINSCSEWILAISSNLDCVDGTFQYKYEQTPDRYYLSPQTSNIIPI